MAADPKKFDAIRRFFSVGIPFNAVLGIQLAELRSGFARLTVPFRPDLIGDSRRPALHGGVLSALMDTAGGAAAFTLASPDDRISTIDMRVDFLRPGESQDLHADATVSRMGNRVASVDVVCFHADRPDRFIATAKAVYSVYRVD